jgi:DNA-binding response OmpR family regulator
MKNIAFYSTDFNMCVSLLMYLQNRYNITATTDLDVLKNIIRTSEFDLVILDTEPSSKIEDICIEIKSELKIPVILTYVYKNQLKDFDYNIRKYVNTIFYKPFDLNEVSMKLSALVA